MSVLSPLRPVDRLLLGLLLPLWLVAFGLHIRAVATTGLAQPGIFVTTPEAGSYPRVGGLRPEQGSEAGTLQIGDRLLRAGARDLRGVGNIAFDAIAIEEGRTTGRVAIEFERGGSHHTTDLPLVPLRVPWMRIPMLLALAGTGLLVLLRGGGSANARFVFAAFIGLAILQSPFHGASYTVTYASKAVFYAGNVVVPPLFFSWLMHFPPGLPPPIAGALWLPWLFVPVAALVRGSYALGGPIPPGIAPLLGPVLDGLVVVVSLALLTRNYRRVDRTGQRRIKWVLYGAYLAGVPVVIVLSAPLVDPQGTWFRNALAVPAIGVCAFPLGVLIAVVRHNLFDIDRLISATTTYSALAVLLAAGTLTVVPLLAGAMSGALGLDPSLSQILISLALAAIVLPAYQRLRPIIDGVLFPERRAFEEGIRQLLSDLSACDSAAALTERAGAELDRLLRPATCVVYGRAGGRFEPVFVRGVDAVPIDGADPLIAVLERRMAPVAAEGSGSHRRALGLSAYERAALEELRVSVVAPVRGRRGIAAFFSLGPKRSGDVYTPTEIAWLSGVADRMSAEFLRFGEARPVDERPRTPTGAATREETTIEPAMLNECPECGTCYSSGTWRCERDGAALASPRVPRVLSDRYRLDRRLGRGGMGTVYEAADLLLGRAVAIKIIREDLAATRDAAERFRKEARATAAFAHPNVVTVHDFGVASPAIPFLVLELLKGCSLREEEDRVGRLPPSRVMEVTRTLCDVLTVAHGRSLVHRDLKPENVFLANHEGREAIKVLDFGLAKFKRGWGTPEVDTHPGMLVGTLAYMAPECFQLGEVHPSWDLWSLAVMVYEMLAGTRPFAGEAAALQLAVRAGRFDPIGRHYPTASTALQQFLERALSPAPDARPASAIQFVHGLAVALSD